jgi:hypothetical protein
MGIEKNPKNYAGKTNTTPYEKYVEKHITTEIVKHIELAKYLVCLCLDFVWVRRGFSVKSNEYQCFQPDAV